MDNKILELLEGISRKQDATDKVLIEINRKQDATEEILIELKEGQTKLQDDIKLLNIKLDKADEKINSITEQTADLVEFRESVTLKIDNLQTNAKFQTHKLNETEEVIFGIKNHLQIIK